MINLPEDISSIIEQECLNRNGFYYFIAYHSTCHRLRNKYYYDRKYVRSILQPQANIDKYLDENKIYNQQIPFNAFDLMGAVKCAQLIDYTIEVDKLLADYIKLIGDIVSNKNLRIGKCMTYINGYKYICNGYTEAAIKKYNLEFVYYNNTMLNPICRVDLINNRK